MSKETSSRSAPDATKYPTTATIDGNEYEVCQCCGLPKKRSILRPLRLLTISLFEQAGYRLVAWRRAWLYRTQAELDAMAGQESLFGDEVEESKRLVGRLSFFRRLSLSKGGIAAKHEDVLFFTLKDKE
jgi:hypothetical protein